jgi:hypothetical protein
MYDRMYWSQQLRLSIPADQVNVLLDLRELPEVTMMWPDESNST